MNLFDIFDIALTNIRHQKIRSWLTILGIVIGVAAIITLISISIGIEQNITQQTSSFGANLITISPGSQMAMRTPGFGPMGGGSRDFGQRSSGSEEKITFKEADALRTMPGVYALDAQIQKRGVAISYKNKNSSLSVVGTEPESFQDIIGLDLEDGRYLNVNDKYSVVIGYNVAHNIFADDDMLNKQIEIDNTAFRVVGILEESGSMGGSDNSIYIPSKTALDVFNLPDEVNQILVLVREGHDVEAVAADLKDELLSLHNLENEDPDFSITTAASVQSAVSSIADTLGLFLGGIASISLIVGGIGVLNTMFISVLEQTRTIGVFKALGAKDRDIIILFLVEAAILGFVGGFVGVVLSLLASTILQSFGVPTAITVDLIALGLVFSIVIGIIAGIIPARNAARISPVEALRYE